MNLWIRTQDRKRLVLINNILAISESTSRSILGYTIDGHVKIILGDYDTEERALEVLDEIQETMCLNKYNYEDIEKTCYQDCYRYKSDIIAIYEMPKS